MPDTHSDTQTVVGNGVKLVGEYVLPGASCRGGTGSSDAAGTGVTAANAPQRLHCHSRLPTDTLRPRTPMTEMIHLEHITKTYEGVEQSLRGTKLEWKGPALWLRNLAKATRLGRLW